MRQKRNKGFTLTELIVVLAIIAILLAVAIPSALNYFKLAEFRKNESNAKTVYLAAESALTWYRSNGSWEDFRKEVIHLGTLNQGFGEGDEAKDRIYAVTLNKDAGESSESGKLVEELLGNLSYDGDFFNASIVIEIDVDTGQVYSAFYGTRCSALKYSRGDEEADREDILEIRNEKRSYEDRRKVLLGYYSVEDVTNVVDIKPVPLKVTSINLVNSETLSLNWSGNSRHENLDVAYTLTFYEKSGGVDSSDKKLFSLTVDLFELRKFGWQSGEVASLKLSYFNGNTDQTEDGWYFPLTYKDGKFSLILDGMMSARLNALLEAKADPDVLAGSGAGGSADDGVKTRKAFNTSITRLGEEISALSDLKAPQNIYAVIEGQCTYHEMGDDIREYSPSTPVTSNTENTLYASVEESQVDGVLVQRAKITRFRHLSNIRYFDKTKTAEFVVARNLDWTASGGGVYDLVEKNGGTGSGATYYELSWKDVVTGEIVLDFPSIPLLSGKHTFTKEGNGTRISNLRLGKDSLANDAWIGKLYQGAASTDAAEKHYSNYLGLFCGLEGHVKDIVFQNPLLVLKGEGTDTEGNPEAAEDFAHLYGVGLLGGRCSGSVEGVSVKTVRKSGGTGAEQKTVEVSLADRNEGTANQKPAGIGGLIGVLADKEDNGTLKPLNGAAGKTISIDHLVMEGAVVGKLPKPDAVTQSAGMALFALEPEADTGDADKIDPVEEAALAYQYGIGGIFGYVWTGEGVDITECQNSADVTGNLFTGGVCGNLTGNFQKSNGNTTGAESLEKCSNEGLVLCSVKTTNTDGRNIEGMDESIEGRYFGGILGFGHKAWVDASTSASGYRGTVPYTLKENDKDKEKLQGWYVGGILGYGADSLLTGCGTKKDGYILGSDYVGGIAGGLSSNIKEAIKGDPAGVTVTVNESYVIGNRYVGGIVGKNDGTSETVIKNCVNNGVAAGYDRYIGGIVGYNGRNGKLEDCASYLSDYNHSVYDRIVTDWKAEGDCAGGLAGYNNGEINFTGTNESIVVKSVSSIVVGGNYVGGVIGFNDADGSVDVHYTLIGGEIYGFGDAVGGCIGLNASQSLLEQEIRIKPRGIKGRNFVGGMIGANVTALSQNITAKKLETDSVLGSIEGDAFVGGLIGYHRTYTQEKLKQAAVAAGMVIRDGDSQIPNVSLLDYLRYGQEIASREDSAEDTTTVDYQDILPRLDGDNLPGDVLGTDDSDTAFTLTITKAPKSTTEDSGETAHKDAWKEDSNNLPIRAYLYVGGIVGYCDKDSRLYLVNCKNVGGISRTTSPVSAGNPSGITDGVSLVKFLEKQKITLTDTEKEEIGDLKVYMVGGMLSANLGNHVIDHCVNKGAMNGFIGLGGIVGFNAGGVFSCRLEDNFGSSELDYIGGIAGLNVGSAGLNTGSGTEDPKRKYIDYAGKEINYRPGSIAGCTTSFGKSVLGRSYVGGIVGYNMRGGMVEDCRSEANVTAVGNAEREIAYVGGIAGCNNGYLAVSQDAGGSRMISASLGVGVGGIAGINQTEGRIYVKSSLSDTAGTGNPGTGGKQPEEIIVVGSENTNVKVTITGWKKVGGIAGINKGRLSARDIGPDAQEGTGTGKDGIGEDSTPYLTCQVNEISAAFGYAGGIVGEAWGDISRVRNRSVKVTANQGPAGGIVAVNGDGITIFECQNFGNVNADKGYAGGIAAENYGRIEDCSVGYQTTADGNVPAGAGPLTVNSRGTEAIGGICAVNHAKGDKIEDDTKDGAKAAANGVIIASVPLAGVTLSGNAGIVGGIAGINRGIIGSSDPSEKTVMKQMPGISSNASGLTVGGAAGENVHIIPENTGAGESSGTGQEAAAGEKSGTIQNVTAEGLEFVGFTNYTYLGGITGRNLAGAEVMLCSFSGKIVQSTDARGGNCYGGIAGENSGELSDCNIRSVNINVKGIYTATGSSTAEQKEVLSSHVGGICGKNERYTDENKNVICGRIAGCVIENAGTDEKTKTTITVSNGMAGGVAGYNKGEIELSGDKTAVVAALLKTNPEGGAKISEADTVKTAAEMIQKAGNKAMDAAKYVEWKDSDLPLESFSYKDNGTGVNANRILSLIMSNNGNVGGITAYNAPTGSVNYCATGNWYLNNKSNAIGVGTGGIIGMNESEQNLSYLVNQAFVGREISKEDTNRFAGGIIGNQNNTTKSEWKIENCANYGIVYCLRTHYSGGILGQWTGTGGSVEHCYNYGNLQTTYEKGWLGAAGGIVAQLYHAYEGDYYNIVSCGNYGNLYGRERAQREEVKDKNGVSLGYFIKNCANDSGGILGNITAYDGAGQTFTIQVLDCVNGSEVEIYSASMSSGIVGFLSCDNAKEADQISRATENIVLRIERCRNFASVLEGGKNKFSAGIFGDRYGEKGSQNTYLSNCYSVNPQNERGNDKYYYYEKDYPILSYRNDTSRADVIHSRNNYFLGEGSGSLDSFVNNKIQDDGSSGDSFTKMSANLNDNNLGRAAANCVYKVQGTSGKYYILYIEPGTEFGAGTSGWPWSAQNWSCEITENGDVLKNKEKIGYVLFNTEKQNFANLEDVVTRHSGIKDNTKVDMDFDYYVRQSYHRIEGAVNGQMPKPQGVKFERTGINKLSIAVDPAVESDPFKYVAILKKGEKVIKEVTFYSNNCTVEVPQEDLQDDITMEVRAYSMYDPDIEPSEPVNPKDYPIVVKILPDPEIRIELTEVTWKQQGTDSFYEATYRYQLLNQEAYADYKGSYDISVKFMDGTDALTLYDGQGAFSVQKTDSLQQLIVQAVPHDANGLKSSAEVPVPVYLPQAVPSISLKDKEGNGIVNATLSGTNLSDVAITVTLDASKSGNVTTPPIYRVELIGTWENGTVDEVKDVVLASQNILAAANGAASATFTDLSQYDYIVDVTDLQVRVWYAESGQGPVYTWHSVDKDGTTGQPVGSSNITILNGAEKSADVWVPEWSYEYSAVLENDGNGQCFQNYVWTSAEIFTWLDAPKLMEDFPKPEYSETNRELYYTFKWDENQNTGNYRLSLSGIDRETGEKVAIVTNEPLTVNQYSAPAEDWNYSQVELTVTSVGNADDKKIGQSSTKIYTVASRLERPGQPVVTNTDVNEMLYQIEWSPIRLEEKGCVSYQIYMQLYDRDGKLTAPIPIGEPVPVSEKEGNRYIRRDIDLESYIAQAVGNPEEGEAGGRSAVIYIVAEADAEKPQEGYVNSLPGITYALQIPSRIKTPSVTWTQNWVYNKDQALSPEAFRQNGMTVSVTPQGEDSIPPGGSTYLLAAYVIDYNSGNAADVEKMINEITQTGILPAQTEVPGWLASYPTEDGTEAVPVQMEVDTSQVYSHSLNGLSAEYAGKYILFCTRISFGNGQFSSKWVPSGLIQLPYVKLAEPIVSGDTRTRTVTMTTYTNPDLPEVSAEEVWNANHIAFNWNSVEYADSYYVTITPKDAEENPAVPVNLKILEEIGAAGEKQLKVYQEQAGGTWTELVPETGEDGSLKYSLAYSLEIEGKYEAGGIPIFYKGTFGASVEAEPDGNGGYQYTVVLPDSNDLTTDDGDVITGSDLRNTASVTVRADVQENEAEPGSGAYVSSDPVESLIGN